MIAPARVAAVADRLFATIEEGDIEGLAALWADDVVVWRLGGGRARDKTRALAVIEWFLATTAHRSYEVIDRRFFDGGFVQQHSLHIDTRSGTGLSFRACLVVTVGDDGLITRIDEYLNPADLLPLATEAP